MTIGLISGKPIAKKIVRSKIPCTHTERGCERCPLRKKRKVINIKRIKGRPIAVWAQAPGKSEEIEGLNLIGPAGQLFWKYANKAGLTRGKCDIQNVVRCRPTQISDYAKVIDRAPNKEEIYHCSKFTDEALAKMRGFKPNPYKVHLVLGNVAAEALLGREYRKDRKTFWSERLQSQVICTYHPSYFLRGAEKSKLKEFKAALKAVVESLNRLKSGRFAFVENKYKSGAYAAVETIEQLKDTIREIKKSCEGTGNRLAIDLEWGKVKGKTEVLCAGLCWEENRARTVFFHHPRRTLTVGFVSDAEVDRMIELLGTEVFENKDILKCLHYGCSDVPISKKYLKKRIKGFRFDTHFSEYIRYPGRYRYSLDAVAETRFHQFVGYKEMIAEYRQNLADVPRKIMTMYNCADSELCKLIELSTKDGISLRVLKIYTYASFTVEKMEQHGPLLDFEQHALVEKILPKKIARLEEKLKMYAQNPAFNPRTPAKVAYVMYKKLKIPKLKERRFDYKTKEWEEVEISGTGIEILDVLGLKYEFPKLMAEFRRLEKENQYLKSYKKSAVMHQGRLSTSWFLAGTAGGRMKSGGGRRDKRKGWVDKGKVNLQQLHGEPIMENMLVSELRWKEVIQ